MWLFFQPRFAFWLVVGLPVSFLGTFAVMSLLGYSINMITMVALLMAIGLLMDDAIMLSENMAARLQQGEDAVEAVIGGTVQVAPGVLASFATTLAVFGPMAFLSGDIGRVLSPLPVVLIVTLAVSFIEACLILPHHLVEPLRTTATSIISMPGPSHRKPTNRRLPWTTVRILYSDFSELCPMVEKSPRRQTTIPVSNAANWRAIKILYMGPRRTGPGSGPNRISQHIDETG